MIDIRDHGGTFSGGIKLKGEEKASVLFAENISVNDPVYLKESRSYSALTLKGNVANMLASTGLNAKFSDDGKRMAVLGNNSPFLYSYKQTRDSYTLLPPPDYSLNGGAGGGMDFSKDGAFFAVGDINQGVTPSRFLAVFRIVGETMTPVLVSQPTYTSVGLSFSPDNKFLAVATNNVPYLGVLVNDGNGNFNRYVYPSALPDRAYSLAFSPDGTHLAVTHNTAPTLSIYKRVGETFTKLATPAVSPAGTYNRAVEYSPDGTYLATGSAGAPFLNWYKREGDTYTKLANPDVLPTNVVNSISYSPDGKYLAVGIDVSPFLLIYEQNGDTLTKLSNLNELPKTAIKSVDFNPANGQLVGTLSAAPWFMFYEGAVTNIKAYRSTKNIKEIDTAVGAGYAKQSGVAGETKEIIKLWK